MFSLVKFHNNKFVVIKTANVQKLKGMTCTAKCNGGTYAAFLVCKSDDKSNLAELKKKKEATLKSKNENSLCFKSSSHIEIPSLLIPSSSMPTIKHDIRKTTLKSKNVNSVSTKLSSQVENTTTHSTINAAVDASRVEFKKKREATSKSNNSDSVCVKSSSYNEVRSSYIPHNKTNGKIDPTVDRAVDIFSEIQRLKSTILKIKHDIKDTANILRNKSVDLISLPNELPNDQVSNSSKEIHCYQSIDTGATEIRDKSSRKNPAIVTDILVLNNFLTPLEENKSSESNFDRDSSFDASSTAKNINSLCENNDPRSKAKPLENCPTTGKKTSALPKSKILENELLSSTEILQDASLNNFQTSVLHDDMLQKKSSINGTNENISAHNIENAILKIQYDSKLADLISIPNQIKNYQPIDTGAIEIRDDEASCKNSAITTDILMLNNFLTPLEENKSSDSSFERDSSFDATQNNKLHLCPRSTTKNINFLCENSDPGSKAKSLQNCSTTGKTTSAFPKSKTLESELLSSNEILQDASLNNSQTSVLPHHMLQKKNSLNDTNEDISGHNIKNAILKIKYDSKSADLISIPNQIKNYKVSNSPKEFYCHQPIDTGAIEIRDDEASCKNSAIVTDILVLNNFLTPLEENKSSESNFERDSSLDATQNDKLLLRPSSTTKNINTLCENSDPGSHAKALENCITTGDESRNLLKSKLLQSELLTSNEILQYSSLNNSQTSVLPDDMLQEKRSINNVNDDSFSYNNTKTSQNSTFMLSTTNVTESSFSEYIPESVDVTKDNLEITNTSITEKDDSIREINDPLNVNKILVPYSKKNIKKHFCIFCKKLQCKLSRHMYLKHKNEEEVKRALALPKTCQERMKIMAHLRKRGDYEHNTSAKYNTGILIVSRQQESHCKNMADDYICCKTCKGFFSKKTLRIHKSVCGTVKGKRSNYIDGRILTQYIHPVANKALKTKIFPVLRYDEITKSIRYDELVIKFANYLAEKYSLEHQHDMIRANLRLIGRFLIEIKKLDPAINELKEIYKTNMYDKCINAIRNVAKWNDTLMGFQTPAVAQNLTSLLKKCGKRQRVEFIKEERDDLKNDVNNFLMLWEEEIPLINKKATEDQSNQKRIKTIVLPSKDDIQKLYNFLKGKIMWAMDNLMKEFCINNWMELVKATLIFIQIFNRRRAGEIERLTCQNFQNKEVITDSIDEEVLKNISKDSLRFAKQFVRISLRGKLGRTVSVLLCPMSIKSIELILKYRNCAGITAENNFIFAKPTTSKLAKQYFRACPLLKQYSKECGAKIPESITGTNLRKHIATYTSMINAEEASVDRMAQFMGHHKDIHKSIYRMSIPVAEITCVSKILMAAVGDDVGDDDDDDEDDEDDDIMENSPECSNEENILIRDSKNDISSSRKKRRSTSPYGKTKRCRWSIAEKEAISSIFGNLTSLKRLPSLEECSNAVHQSEVLSKRTPQQIKSWIDNQRRHKIT